MADDAAMPVQSPASEDPGARFDYVVLHSGGLGDLCLLSNLVASLKSDPSARVGLICQSRFRGVAELYPVPPDQVIAIDLNPGLWEAPTDELVQALRPVVGRLA